ncbi:unnamed protein product [marine sediment metagenome]|uniref:Uncharacterized protein n=1 Tax=marine sediment metagenome TaxID=412755 RepID=X1E3E8_9ZZZZ
MLEQEEIQIAVNKFIEIIYEMYLKDLKSGNMANKSLKSYGKICKRRGFINGYKNPTLFNIGK